MFKKLNGTAQSKGARLEIVRQRNSVVDELRDKIPNGSARNGDARPPSLHDNGPLLADMIGGQDSTLASPFLLDVARAETSGKGSDNLVHYAIRTDNFDLLQNLAATGIRDGTWKRDVEEPALGRRAERPIHVAAEMNNLKAFKFLVEHGANLHSTQQDYHETQALHVAAANGAFDIVKYLIEELKEYKDQPFISAVDKDGDTALHWSMLGQHKECIKLLLANGGRVDLKQTADAQCTPLHFACLERAVEIVQLLAQEKPEEFQNALVMQDVEGFTPLQRSMPLDCPELVQFLVDKGAPLDLLDNEGRSPIIFGAIRESWLSVEVLLKAGVNPVTCDPVFQRTPFHHAALAGSNPAECAELLRKIQENPEWKKPLNAMDSFGYTALQYAAGSGKVDAFKGFLQMGADIEVRNRKYKSVLHYAAKYGQIDIMRAIMEDPRGQLMINAIDHQGRSALHMASGYGHLEAVELLLRKGAFAFRDDAGRTPFHMAAIRNHYQIMNSLAAYFAIVTYDDDKEGSTGLHLAAANDAAEAVQALLAGMMDENDVREAAQRKDKQHQTPLDLVIKHKSQRAALAFVNSKHWRILMGLESEVYGTVVLGFIRHLPEVMLKCLDRCVADNQEDDDGTFIKYDFSVLHENEDENSRKKERNPMRALRLMASLRRSELLAHPLCTTLLERKWMYYGMYCSGIIMVSNVIFVTVLSYVLMSAVRLDLRPHLMNVSRSNVEQYHPKGLAAINGSEFDALHEEIRNSPEHTFNDTPALITLTGYRYFIHWMNYMEMILFVSSGGFIVCLFLDYRSGEIGPATYQLGCIAVFLAWFNMLRFFRPFGTLGIYSFMFFSIMKTMVLVSCYFFLLLAAFTAVFSTLFQTKIFPNSKDYYDRNPDLNPDDLRTSHGNVITSGLRIGAMTIGDLEILDNFLYPFMDEMLAFPVLSYLFYALFLVLMPILLNNLLIGLAIGDMEAIRKNAVTLRLEMQVFLHESLERLFPAKLQKRFRDLTQEYKIYKHQTLDAKTRIARWLQSGSELSRTIPTLAADQSDDHHPEQPDANEDTVKMTQRLKQLDDTVAQLRETMSLMKERNEEPSELTPTDAVLSDYTLDAIPLDSTTASRGDPMKIIDL